MDYTIAFWIVMGLLGLMLIAAIVIAILQSFYVPELYDGMFRFADMSINHKGATKMTALVHLVYSPRTAANRMATSEDVLKTVQAVMNSPSFQTSAPWEVVAKDVATQVWNDFRVMGVSVQLLVDGEGATFTRGAGTRVLNFVDPGAN